MQKLLNITPYVEYQSINFPLNSDWSAQPEIVVPTTRNLTYLLDTAKIRVLVLNGVYDVSMYAYVYHSPSCRNQLTHMT